MKHIVEVHDTKGLNWIAPAAYAAETNVTDPHVLKIAGGASTFTDEASAEDHAKVLRYEFACGAQDVRVRSEKETEDDE